MEARLMDQDIPTKKCTTCKLSLSYDEFSERTTNLKRYPDGYDDICRPCMRWYRKRSYARSKDPNYHAPISRVPLRDYNVATLDSYIKGKFIGTYSILGKGVNSELDYELVLDFRETGEWNASLACKTSGKNLKSWTVYSTVNWKSFSGNFLDVLWEDEIRLVEKS